MLKGGIIRRNPASAADDGSVFEPVSARDRILDVAAELFYQLGVRAVGVDLIVERSHVAKTSLYRHFATKDNLVAAVLERDDAAYWHDWDAIAGQYHRDPRAELEAHLQWISDYTLRPEYRGCPFINVATEFPTSDHPARVVAIRHKTELHRRLSALAASAGTPDPDGLADQLILLIDGAYVDGHLLGTSGPARALVPAAQALIGCTSRTIPTSGSVDGALRVTRGGYPSRP